VYAYKIEVKGDVGIFLNLGMQLCYLRQFDPLSLKHWTFGILSPIKNVPSQKSVEENFYIGCPHSEKSNG